jgi:hypothetical protein
MHAIKSEKRKRRDLREMSPEKYGSVIDHGHAETLINTESDAPNN